MIKWIKKKVVEHLNNMKLRTKLLVSYFILILVPLSLLTLISYNHISKTIEELILYSAKQNFDQTNSFLEYKISKVVDISSIISVDKNLTNILTKDLNNYEYAEQIKDAQDLNTIYLNPYQNDNDVYRVRLFVREEVLYSQERINLFSLKSVENESWYKDLMSRKNKILWCSPQSFTDEAGNQAKVVSARRVILNPNKYEDIIGIFSIDIQESDIKDILKKANSTEGGVAYLQNSFGELITSSDEGIMHSLNIDSGLFNTLPNTENAWEEINLNGKRLLVGSNYIKETDWVMVSVIPYKEILTTGNVLRKQMLLLLGIMVSVAYAFAYYLSVSNTRRIGQLIRRMRKAQVGELESINVPASKDEVGELINNFNFMIHKMRILIEDQYKIGQEIKSAELKALQAQINPHFLYNTLDLINWTAIRNNIPEISSIVQSLAKFYKLSLSKGKDVISIADELMHVMLYVDIQNKRFQNNIHLNIEVDENILECRILKIILQPIVENSILHGILEKDNKEGSITISGKMDGDIIILKVLDNGIGMDEKTIEKIMHSSITRESHGYGVRNINDRIKLRYGEAYGLSYRSKPGIGTEVEIRFPKDITQNSKTRIKISHTSSLNDSESVRNL
jgi:two-component system sensor histidine kinase YesM